MKQEIINKGIESLQKIRMSHNEEFDILEKLMAHADETIVLEQSKPIKSPFFTLYIPSLFVKPQYAYAVFSFIGVFFISASALFGAILATPGNVLYPLKATVVEPIQDLLATTPLAKAQLSATRAEDTLKKVELLIKNNNLTADTRASLEEEFRQHTNDFNNFIQTTGATTSVNISIATTNLKNTIEEHSKLLHTMKENTHAKQNDEIEKFSATINATFNEHKEEDGPTDKSYQENIPTEIPLQNERKKNILENVVEKHESKERKIRTSLPQQKNRENVQTTTPTHIINTSPQENEEEETISISSSTEQVATSTQSTTNDIRETYNLHEKENSSREKRKDKRPPVLFIPIEPISTSTSIVTSTSITATSTLISTTTIEIVLPVNATTSINSSTTSTHTENN